MPGRGRLRLRQLWSRSQAQYYPLGTYYLQATSVIPMIVITGATGNVGRPLVDTLTAAGEDVVPVSRSGAGHQADLTKPEALRPVLDGAKGVFLLTSADFLARGNVQDVVDVLRDADV